ncbi:methylmalonyl-CoA mutase subunit beta [Caulobacter sp. 17J80-11]|uniref:methylmalonyl-CoA mutase subunit beta n=1 Tax=Caulobacter sp. 17J80-11 TaxID=2763502 RepID=UPI00351C4515
MRNPATPLAQEFSPPTREQWMALVDKTLKGAPFDKRLVARTYDGLTVQPLYTAEDGAPALAARPRPHADPARPWDLRTVVDHADPARANADLLKDLQNGAASVLVRIDPTGVDGVAVGGQDELARVLSGVLLDLAPVALDAGLLGPQAANALAVLAKGAPEAPLAFHLDPLSAFAEAGATAGPIESHVVSAAQTAARHAPAYPKASLFLASGRVAHEAGGSEVQELGFMAAAALAYAKAMTRAGLSMQAAFERMVLGLSADAEYFTTVAKLRAARAIWARLTAACEVEATARIEARSSRRMLSKLDPWVNLLRLTAAGFGAGVGGADAAVLEPFTRPLGRATEFARRQARNTQLVLMEEAALGRVADPAGGAWFLERLTDDLARAGWAVFQAIERQGGVVAALENGFVAEEIAKVRAAREADVAKRKTGLIGTSEFPNLGEASVASEEVDPAAFAKAADVRLPGPDGRCPALAPVRLSEPFEALRERALQLEPKPQVFIATLGGASDYTARLGFSRNLFAAGGIAAVVGAPDAYDAATAPIAVIASSDERYAAEAGAAAAELQHRGAKRVFLAGRPGDLEAELKSAGVDDFLFAGGDITAVLDAALSALEHARGN